jgi:hypothetical protein
MAEQKAPQTQATLGLTGLAHFLHPGHYWHYGAYHVAGHSCGFTALPGDGGCLR